MAETTIEAVKSLSFPYPRPKERRLEDAEKDFRRWLNRAPEKTVNDDEPPAAAFSVPLMSSEGILILAQAHEEQFSYVAHAYEQTALHFPEEPEQMEMDLFVVVDEEI